jgi:hypothetical protein
VPRTLTLLTLLLAACPTRPPAPAPTPSSGSGPAPELEVRFDDARNETLVRIVAPAALEGATLLAGATYAGRTIAARPETVLLGVRHVGGEWRYEGCAAVQFLRDGARAAEVPCSRDAQIGGGKLTEIISAAVPFDLARSLASAGRVAMRLCRTEHALSDAEQAALRRFVQHLTPPR